MHSPNTRPDPSPVNPTMPPKVEEPMRTPPEVPNDPLPHTVDGFPVGEGSYEGTRGYQDRIDTYLETADVAQDAADAAPESRAEANELREAEKEAAERSRAPGK